MECKEVTLRKAQPESERHRPRREPRLPQPVPQPGELRPVPLVRGGGAVDRSSGDVLVVDTDNNRVERFG